MDVLSTISPGTHASGPGELIQFKPEKVNRKQGRGSRTRALMSSPLSASLTSGNVQNFAPSSRKADSYEGSWTLLGSPSIRVVCKRHYHVLQERQLGVFSPRDPLSQETSLSSSFVTSAALEGERKSGGTKSRNDLRNGARSIEKGSGFLLSGMRSKGMRSEREGIFSPPQAFMGFWNRKVEEKSKEEEKVQEEKQEEEKGEEERIEEEENSNKDVEGEENRILSDDSTFLDAELSLPPEMEIETDITGKSALEEERQEKEEAGAGNFFSSLAKATMNLVGENDESEEKNGSASAITVEMRASEEKGEREVEMQQMVDRLKEGFGGIENLVGKEADLENELFAEVRELEENREHEGTGTEEGLRVEGAMALEVGEEKNNINEVEGELLVESEIEEKLCLEEPVLARGSENFVQAKELLSDLARSMEQLEKGLNVRQDEIFESSQIIDGIKTESTDTPSEGSSNVVRNAEAKLRRMSLQLQAMERDGREKDLTLKQLLSQTRVFQNRVVEVEEKSAKEKEELKQKLTEEKKEVEKDLSKAVQREAGLREKLREAEAGMEQRDMLLQQLQEEAALSANALQQAARAMVAARDRTLAVEEQLESMGDALEKERSSTQKERQRASRIAAELMESRMLAEEKSERIRELEGKVEEKDAVVDAAKEEALRTNQLLEQANQALSEAQSEIEELKKEVVEGAEKLQDEKSTSEKALKSVEEKDSELREAKVRIASLTSEVESFKKMVESRDRMMAAVREETVKNAELLLHASQNRKQLAEAELRLEQLRAQLTAAEEQVRSQDSLLAEVRAEAVSSTEAFRMATEYKRELNAAREREEELMELMEEKEEQISRLRSELLDNSRAKQAEQALVEAEKRMEELRREREILIQGMEKKDAALEAMKTELERSSDMLNAAADTREALRTMKNQMDRMQSDAQAKEERLTKLQEEFVTALQGYQFPSLDKKALRSQLNKRQRIREQSDVPPLVVPPQDKASNTSSDQPTSSSLSPLSPPSHPSSPTSPSTTSTSPSPPRQGDSSPQKAAGSNQKSPSNNPSSSQKRGGRRKP